MEGGSAMTAIITGMSDVTTIVGSVFSLITGNPLLALFLSGSLVGLGIGIFRRVKGAAK